MPVITLLIVINENYFLILSGNTYYFTVFVEGGRISISSLLSITMFQFPQATETIRFILVVMSVWIVGIQPCRAEVAKMSIAFKTDHVIATVGFLCGGVARRTWS
jgi:hypothetical protein